MGIQLLDPDDAPEVWDYIELNGVQSPGPCGIPSSVYRRLKLEVQQSIGFKGGYLVLRGEELPTLPYTMRLWTRDHWREGGAFYDVLIEGYKRGINTVLRLDDPAVIPLGFTRVAVEAIGQPVRKEDGGSLYTVQFELKHHKKRRPLQSAPRGPKTEAEKAIEAARAERDAAARELAAAEAALAKGK